MVSQRGKILLLVFFSSICASAVLTNYYLQLRSDRVKPVELYEVVNHQLDAFRADDFPRAYQQASAEFKQKFNIRQFAEMIRANYAGLARAERVEFGAFECRGRRATLQVFFIDRAGEVTPCIYSLVSEGDAWKIDGARLMQRWTAGVRLGGIRS